MYTPVFYKNLGFQPASSFLIYPLFSLKSFLHFAMAKAQVSYLIFYFILASSFLGKCPRILEFLHFCWCNKNSFTNQSMPESQIRLSYGIVILPQTIYTHCHILVVISSDTINIISSQSTNFQASSFLNFWGSSPSSPVS